jgi:hypothetical protein
MKIDSKEGEIKQICECENDLRINPQINII